MTAQEAAGVAFWRSLKDHEFYGPRVQHLYLYSDVTEESVTKLREEVLAACRSEKTPTGGAWTSPKPIVLHVHSIGGSVYAMQWLLSLFNQVHVPVCALVDGYSASAATAISVMAPYRVGTSHSMSLLHDGSDVVVGNREDVLEMVRASEVEHVAFRRLYAARTRITETAMDAMMRRDMWLDAPTCLRLGVYDRVISPDRRADVRRYIASSKMARLSLSDAPFFKTNWNRVYARCDVEGARGFDAILGSEDQAKPVLYVAPGSGCGDRMAAVAMIARVLSSGVPVFGIVDNVVTWWQLLPVLFCNRRFMYENATLDSNMVYQVAWGARLEDINHNVAAFRAIVRGAVRARGRPTAALLADMFDRRRFFTAQECKDNGLIDEVVSLSAGVSRPG
jgi:ATP-dependent protease ClpP protease subunit